MLTIQDHGTSLCDQLSRRDWLRLGGLGALAAMLGGNVHADNRPRERSFGKAKACILVCLLGGPPQHETWDPKPNAIEEIRGPFQPIASSVPGLMVSELMPRLASLAHHFAVLRAVSTRDNAHSSSGYQMLTGVPHVPLNVENARPGAPNHWPSLAALVNKLKTRPGGMPASLVLPDNIWNDGNIPWPGQDAGFLGRAADPWLLHCDPSQPSFEVPGVTMPDDVSALRFDRRHTMLEQLDRHARTLERGASVAGYQHQFQQALDVVARGSVRHAFDLSREPNQVRDRYGRFRFGQSLLLARRLVESGVPFVQVNWTRVANVPNNGSWDTHAQNAVSLRDHLMPMMDRCCSALVEDLQLRGMLDETLVVWMGEFGRTPRHNGNGGRDHWGSVFSQAFAGGGVRGGTVHGSSDAQGAQPRDGMVPACDFNATILHLLGIDPHTEVNDPQGRPIAISRGRPVWQIL